METGGAQPSSEEEESSEQWILAVVAGLGFATYAILAFLTLRGDGPLLALVLAIAGPMWISAVHRDWLGLAAMWAAIFVWYQLFVASAQGYSMFDTEWAGYVTIFVAGFCVIIGLVFGFFYLVGIPFRGLDLSRFCRLSAAVAVPGVTAILLTGLFLQWSPFKHSFELTPPAGWTQVASSYSYDIPVTMTYRPQGKTTGSPSIAVSVAPDAIARVSEDCLWRSYGWPYSSRGPRFQTEESSVEPMSSAPSGFPGAYETGFLRADGYRFYTMSVGRQRLVGALLESLCYTVIFELPPGSDLRPTEVSAVFSTFRFR